MSIDVRLVRRLPDDVELLAVPVAADDPRLAEVHAEEVDSDDSPLPHGQGLPADLSVRCADDHEGLSL
jgi:hypothetical protein